ncbi:ATP-DEPENDENT HELICASE HRQ1 [Salix viminalis]|uniref:ATP-DEPENDENT HELICASE HRQ1 n=1 Tax=Salix viminalis TaxID=40686 RepID=A0A9Q0ZIE1_SALVM|nr:ATP-DEPENDENT HELICASE HRQ1 [Salix viminalis]
MFFLGSEANREIFSVGNSVATNALEFGVDVGHIDVTLHLGFPGSVASLWQQAGRSGRREKPSLAVYVAFQGPLDQYFMKFPKKLFRCPIECYHIDAQNQQV